MAPPIPSPIDRIAQGIVTEFAVAKGQLVGFVDVDWLEKRIARLIRDTIMTEHERCANLAEHYKNAQITDIDTWAEGFAFAKKMIARNIRDLPLSV